MNGLTSSRQLAAVKVAALGMVEAAPEAVGELRKNPGAWSAGSESPATHLKLADEQAVLGTVALLRAIEQSNWQHRSFTEWAVVAAPRFLGRTRAAGAVTRYRRLGPRALSPLIIPTLSLHSISGVVSLILQSHGSNFGTSGERTHLSEALLTGLALQYDRRSPGVWVILTGWEPEPRLDENDRICNSVMGYGVAMALEHETASETGIRLQYDPSLILDTMVPASIRDLANALRNPDAMHRWNCPVEGGGIITLESNAQVQSHAA